ncbi:haloacid dehalogenase [Peptostreptococcus sp. MV1]|uniref:HAD family hydrolase n=1 Tax=Peptostreptococcus sp. MV1 TaxID=1219626 RepID=UPI0005101B9D|nr:HAD family hydrolase [Peptostreptococcus sp. MV1]KGF12803.1 haloacid dehalogenase [Peptostreptococcus sp. MV1]
MIKGIFCDLDGTLYRGGISPQDVKAIDEARLHGINFNIATGRVFKHSINILEEVATGGYLICENGSYIYDPDGTCIYKANLTDDQVKKIIEVYRSLDYIDPVEDVIYFKYEGQVIMATDGSSADYFTKGYEVDGNFMDRDTFDDKIGNIGILSPDKDKLNMLVDKYRKELSSDLEVYLSSETTINIVPSGVSKFEAIKMVCKKENISLDEIVTIGDSPNDISMLKNVKMSFVMDNALDIVKAEAKFSTPSVADAIKMVIDYNDEIGG